MGYWQKPSRLIYKLQLICYIACLARSVDWTEGTLIKLQKKGDLRNCSNYRGIMLLSVPGKVLNRIILERMKMTVDIQLRDEQAGFRKNRSCSDQITTLRIIVEQSLEWNSPLYINFIDYEKPLIVLTGRHCGS